MNHHIALSPLFRKLVSALIGFCLLGLTNAVFALTVTVSIPPLAGIIAPLLGAEDELHILLKPGLSPHGFQLKPSHVKLLQDSDLVISVGTPVDAWIEKPSQLVNKKPIAMAKMAEVERLALRQGGLWEDKHVHALEALADDHDSAGHESDGHDVEGHDADNHSVENNHGKSVALNVLPQSVDDSRLDGHLWMSLQNAKQLVVVVSQQLQALQPEKKQAIQQRTTEWLAQLDKTNQAIQADLAAVQSAPFLVLHDAFQYFEHQYGLNGIGSIRLNPELAPSLQRVHELRQRIKNGYVSCLFKEPQFPEKRVLSVVSGLDVKLGSLDPMGTSYSLGNSFMPYDAFLQALAHQFSSCLSQDKVR